MQERSNESMQARRPVDIIFDTDMHTDCDDAGALAVLHALADERRVRIVGTVHTAPTPFGAQCVDAINTYYGRGATPVAGMTWVDYATAARYQRYRDNARWIEDLGADYVEIIASQFPRTQTKVGAVVQNSVALYRQLLATAADSSIVVCAVGQLTALAGLLASAPDDVSALPGAELVGKKVKLLVTMGLGIWPEGEDGFNWATDIPAAARVLNNWPGPLAVMPHGGDVLTGNRLVAITPTSNPVRRIYELFVPHVFPERNDHCRSSWDQCAVLYAATGFDDIFAGKPGYRLKFDGTSGKHHWKEDPTSPHVYIEQLTPSATVAEIVEELMCRSPSLV
jgi:hypothetical protein